MKIDSQLSRTHLSSYVNNIKEKRDAESALVIDTRYEENEEVRFINFRPLREAEKSNALFKSVIEFACENDLFDTVQGSYRVIKQVAKYNESHPASRIDQPRVILSIFGDSLLYAFRWAIEYDKPKLAICIITQIKKIHASDQNLDDERYSGLSDRLHKVCGDAQYWYSDHAKWRPVEKDEIQRAEVRNTLYQQISAAFKNIPRVTTL
jgi:hypothetical protein